jgi:hypothetical protein
MSTMIWRLRQGPTARRVLHPRGRLAFKMLKRVKVKGGREGRLCVAPVYGRQLERFLSVT